MFWFGYLCEIRFNMRVNENIRRIWFWIWKDDEIYFEVI